MALTLDIAQRLTRAGLIAHFEANRAAWQDNAQDAYDYTKKGFDGEQVRPDDVAKALRPVVEIDKGLRIALDKRKLSQKYWIDFYTSLVIDSSWPALKK
jgi:hypothetical protein